MHFVRPDGIRPNNIRPNEPKDVMTEQVISSPLVGVHESNAPQLFCNYFVGSCWPTHSGYLMLTTTTLASRHIIKTRVNYCININKTSRSLIIKG